MSTAPMGEPSRRDFVLAAGLVGFASVAEAAPAVKPKPNPIVGTWVRVSIASAGEVYQSKPNLRWEFTANGRRITTRGDNRTEARFTADQGAAPMTIDFDIGLHGVYKVVGDTLTIALADRAVKRPANFDTPADDQVGVYVFRRVKVD
jgi:uncharacterized protein (TIGR03067 family)